MDDPGLHAASLEAALTGLARLNAVSFSHGTLWRVIEGEASRADQPLRVLDIACARGDWVLWAAARAARCGVRACFAGCDINPHAIDLATRTGAARGLPCTFFTHDAVRGPLPGDYDVLVASLFLHHLGDADAESLLRRMAAAAKRAVVVNDLVRSGLNLALVGAASRVLTRSPIVHTDAALSVRAAFTRGELLAMAKRAGLNECRVTFGGLGRMMLVHRRAA